MLDATVAADMAASTMRLALSVTRRCCGSPWRDIVARNVAEPVLARRGPRAERHWLTPNQARRLLKVAKEDRLGNLLTISLLLGLRPGEAAGLTWWRVQLDSGDPTITIAASLRRQPDGQLVLAEPKTASSRRRLLLPAQAVEALRRQKTAQDADRKAAGKGEHRHLHPHLLRHAAASLLSAAGVPIVDISDTLGHRSVTVTAEIYRHPIAPVRAGHVAAMDTITGGSRRRVTSGA